MSNLTEAMSKIPNTCPGQVRATGAVEKECQKLTNRLDRDKIATVFHLHVYAFNCDEKRHTEPNWFHMDYVAGGGRQEVPGSVEVTIKALEHCIAELKKKVQ